MKRNLIDAVLLVLGVLCASFGLKGFLLPNEFIDGGVTGISLLISELTQWPLSLLLVAINLPFIILGYSQIGREFSVKSILAIIGLALVVHFIDFHIVTQDKLLVAIFGGFFLGAGIGLAIRGGAVLDGTEVLAIYISRKTGLTIGDTILVFNIFIFGVAAHLLSVETALYAILTYLCASKTVDFVIRGVEEYLGVTIISPKSTEIRSMITHELGRGATTYNGKGGYAENEDALTSYDIIFTVITRLEIAKLQARIDAIDPKAFVIMNSVKDTRGGMVKRRPLA
ncbi:MAG: YitT family protein [Polyangiaceae bacterium]|nr:YitT family protein [Polyangiaceae bacterium]